MSFWGKGEWRCWCSGTWEVDIHWMRCAHILELAHGMDTWTEIKDQDAPEKLVNCSVFATKKWDDEWRSELRTSCNVSSVICSLTACSFSQEKKPTRILRESFPVGIKFSHKKYVSKPCKEQTAVMAVVDTPAHLQDGVTHSLRGREQLGCWCSQSWVSP